MKAHKIIYKPSKLQGFTLTEILIAVAVIAILIAVIVPNLGDNKIKAKTTKQQQTLQMVSNAKSRYEVAASPTEVTAFNAMTPDQKLVVLYPFMAQQGNKPTSKMDLVKGTLHDSQSAVLDPGGIDLQSTPTSEASAVTLTTPAPAPEPTIVNPIGSVGGGGRVRTR